MESPLGAGARRSSNMVHVFPSCTQGAAVQAIENTSRLQGTTAAADIKLSLTDRVSTFIAELDLNSTITPPLIGLCKNLPEDKITLMHLSVLRQFA